MIQVLGWANSRALDLGLGKNKQDSMPAFPSLSHQGELSSTAQAKPLNTGRSQGQLSCPHALGPATHTYASRARSTVLPSQGVDSPSQALQPVRAWFTGAFAIKASSTVFPR